MVRAAQKGEARDGVTPCGLLLVQLRFATGLTSEEYVRQQAWRKANLEHCPLHPRGGCGFARHTSYERKNPAGLIVSRWYCPKGHRTFSLLPDCAASRLSSSLLEIEAVVVEVEASGSLEEAATRLRPAIEPAGAVRWARRRVNAVRALLVTLVGLLPHLLAGAEPTIRSLGVVLGAPAVLPALREVAAVHLGHLPPPVGFGNRPARRHRSCSSQHKVGPDPPPRLR